MPYAVMIGCVVGATALIPFVGAYIGAAVGAVLIFTVAPIKALFFLIFLVVLQQIESNLIYPHVVGGSIGLPGMWVLIAIAIGGSFGGIVGIVLSVPIMATVYHLAKDATEERRSQVRIERARSQTNDQLEAALQQSSASDPDAAEGGRSAQQEGGASDALAEAGSSTAGCALLDGDAPSDSDAPGKGCSDEDADSEGKDGTLFDQLLDAAASLGSSVGLSKRGKK